MVVAGPRRSPWVAADGHQMVTFSKLVRRDGAVTSHASSTVTRSEGGRHFGQSSASQGNLGQARTLALAMASITPLQRLILERLRAWGPDGNPSSAQDDSAMANRLSKELEVAPGDLYEPLRVLRERGLFVVESRRGYGRVSHFSETGNRMLETLEAAEAKAASDGPPVIFISCGQWAEDEKQIGRRLAHIVNTETTARGFFAEDQNTLGALTAEILKPLSKCVGFIAVMHNRGQVRLGALPPFNRGSVWIEQEIAMAALLKQIFERDIRILLYTNVDIALEGIRQQLLIHPIPFTGIDDLVTDFRNKLRSDFAQYVKPQVYLTAHPLQACEPADDQKGTHVAFKTDFRVHNETKERFESLRLHLALPPGWGPIRVPGHKVDGDPEAPQPGAPPNSSAFSLLLTGPFAPGDVSPFNDIAFAAPVLAAAAPRVLWRIDYGTESTPSKGSAFALLSDTWPP